MRRGAADDRGLGEGQPQLTRQRFLVELRDQALAHRRGGPAPSHSSRALNLLGGAGLILDLAHRVHELVIDVYTYASPSLHTYVPVSVLFQ
jgi:hypothetical protein